MKTYNLTKKEQDLIAKQKLERQNRMTLKTLAKASRSPVKYEKTVILGDISGSMAGYKMHELKRCLAEVWGPGLEGIVFGSELWTIEESDIPKLDTAGDTHLFEALCVAWDEHYTHIVLLTDGEPTDECEEEILRVVAERHTDVPIDTVGIGQHGHSDYNPEFLRKLAELTGGRFTDCGEPIMLTSIVQHLLEYKPDGLPEGEPEKGKGVIHL